MLLCNPGLADLISEKIGEDWVTNLDELAKLRYLVDDPTFLQVKRRLGNHLSGFSTRIQFVVNEVLSTRTKK